MMLYPPSFKALEDRLNAAPEGAQKKLAGDLITMAKAFDLAATARMLAKPYHRLPARDLANPLSFTSPVVIGKDWADKDPDPLEAGEEWNEGRRATQSGVGYAINSEGYPVNPYMQTGLAGRGVLGCFGPNHAVDNGLVVIVAPESSHDSCPVSVLGIKRGAEDGFAPALSGGFMSFKKTQAGYVMDRQAVAEIQAKEFVEEVISGSLTLPAHLEAQADTVNAASIAAITSARGGKAPDAEEQAEITREHRVGYKMQLIADADPDFFPRLTRFFESAAPVFAGPALADPRNTDTSWIETSFGALVWDDASLKNLLADNPLGLTLKAGDDATDVLAHPLTPEIVKTAYASHGAFMLGLAAHVMLTNHGARPDVQAHMTHLLKSVQPSMKP